MVIGTLVSGHLTVPNGGGSSPRVCGAGMRLERPDADEAAQFVGLGKFLS